MNYSTLKKTVALSFVAAMGFGVANAQTTDGTGTTTPKVFGGAGQYRTWYFGINAGATSPALATGGSQDYKSHDIKPAFGINVRKQLAHQFGIQLDLQGGWVGFSNRTNADPGASRDNRKAVKTFYQSAALGGVFNFATIDFLHRKNSVNFFAKAAIGLANYHPEITLPNGTTATDPAAAYYNTDGTKKWVQEMIVPVGVGVKFRLSEVTALNFGYDQTFVNGDNFDGLNRAYPTKDRYSYGYGGLEFTLGSKSKPDLQWVNPVALMYDELYDAELRKEVAALKGRVANVETAVNDLKKDSDGDGVSDQFDKCPNTPAGTVVDGAGCEIKFPAAVAAPAEPVAAAYSAIQFDFDSSVLRTSSYPALDATSADLRSGSGSLEVQGFASSEGTAAHNLRLSKDRANAVKTYLVNSGVDAKRVKVKGFGETKPIADNSTEEGRVLNRRVQFQR
ncbi:OmpA family protein [Mucilaginibacter myungsuensis]|uniref:OmpA family protein n=1 Tax=Mucilaginibacter myungsuensis TaxID=649104 RepID=A0A929PWQ3_9SPHI|nr:OmpA family protein [Mucilaginibacter myungsuensis]MBE9662331.1 OmpA family protein [Mucilaginibacter myungsuensis]MDN3599232.1 OmpA family protein [Mucilaginibacter myungsuensis]